MRSRKLTPFLLSAMMCSALSLGSVSRRTWEPKNVVEIKFLTENDELTAKKLDPKSDQVDRISKT